MPDPKSESNFDPVETTVVPQFHGNVPIVFKANPDTSQASVSGAINVKVIVPICVDENGHPIFSAQSSLVKQDELTIEIKRGHLSNVMEVAFHTKSSPQKDVAAVADPVVILTIANAKEGGHQIRFLVSEDLKNGAVYSHGFGPLPILPAPPKKEVIKK